VTWWECEGVHLLGYGRALEVQQRAKTNALGDVSRLRP
jgi:hypothetical protein